MPEPDLFARLLADAPAHVRFILARPRFECRHCGAVEMTDRTGLGERGAAEQFKAFIDTHRGCTEKAAGLDAADGGGGT